MRRIWGVRGWLLTALLLGIAIAALGLVPAHGSTLAGARPLAGCFNHLGVQLNSNNAYECIYQDSAPGALYWQHNNNDYEWDLHPASGNLPVNAITFPLGHQNQYYGFTAVVDSFSGGCVVQGAGYGQSPTACANPGQPPHTMTPRQQRSYDAFAAIMEKGIPDCAWMPAGTTPSQTC